VVDKFQADKSILVAEYSVQADAEIDFDFRKREMRERAEESADQQGARVKRESWNPFAQDYLAVVSEPGIRSVVWDTASETNETLRLANFGKLEKNPQIAYGPINTEFKMLVRKAHEHQKNLILLHQIAPEYKTVQDASGRDKSIETGKMKRRGNNQIGYLVHSYVETFKVPTTRSAKTGEVTAPPKFMVRVLQARLNPEADGMVLESPDWVSLMMVLAPGIDAERWL